MSCIKTRRHFTEAAREAAALARQRRREHRERFPDEHAFELVVLRVPGPPTGFGWQIRRFGHLRPAAESEGVFGSAADAERSGRAALGALRAGASGS